ncbi:4'-phosphopantetheinyl transferase superfamily protein [Sphingobacterium sp. HMA12]|uniref:4'-phosphopantetheinyl transferase family protein n=1 Tax=Sphingobacterium sp. HMA12 TaxID=2050894 RepID=UPI000CEA0AC8|nr:4'-phosphopantetheinyl transferase superfamily protein [Sphingobacterium sp. HMA12]
MIGNDVIDLVQSRKDSNWQRRGFIPKLFGADEQLLIANSSDPETTLWLLWSMKEAAYKIWNRETKMRKYMPKELVCTISRQSNSNACGRVVCEANTYYTETIFAPDFIHTIAVSVFSHLDYVIEIEKNEIVKDNLGFPYIALAGGKELFSASVSNHGRFEKVVAILRI